MITIYAAAINNYVRSFHAHAMGAIHTCESDSQLNGYFNRSAFAVNNERICTDSSDIYSRRTSFSKDSRHFSHSKLL